MMTEKEHWASMRVKIEGIEMLEAIEGYVPEQAKIVLLVNRDTAKQQSEIDALVAYKEKVGGALEIQVRPVDKEKEGADA